MDGLKRIMLQDLTDKVSEICDNFYENCVALLARLVACQSISGNERECAEVLVTFFRDRNIPCFRDSRGSVLAVSLPRQFEPEPLSEHGENAGKWLRVELKKARDKGLKILAFNAHMDVVSAENPEEWTSDPFWAVRRNGRIYGRGTCDMKGALAAMAMSMAVAREVDRDFDRKCVVLGCFCTEEEVAEGLAFRDLFEEFGLKPDMVILGEPSKMQIARGQRGKLEIMV
ncbi:MAG: M20/M25/M40 family metallo-hydrolase, partial [Candidatus Riflebacteria bacterium]|nr:M20/M25/M40 family metallo-hydrolase [Candidatus Riflebacteria bacterium]